MKLSLYNKPEPIELEDEMYDLYTVNLKKKDINRIKKTALFIARKGCPKDSHNMALNAIYAINTKDGFAIVWDDRYAYYLPYVDKGINPLFPNSAKVKANKGFVDRSLALVWSYFYYNPLTFSPNKNPFAKETREANSNKFAQMEGLYKNDISKTREAPLFVKMAHDYKKGKTNMEITEGNERLLTNLYKSMKKYQADISDENSNSELDDTDIIFDIDKQKVFEK